jgi:transposase
MKKKQIQRARVFSEDFKKSLVNEYESGKLSVLELSELHKITTAVIYRWIYRYSTYQNKSVKVVEMSESSTLKVKQLQSRIAELERIVGQKQLNIDFLEKMIDLAKDHYGIDVKKNSATPQSTGFTKTEGQ